MRWRSKIGCWGAALVTAAAVAGCSSSTGVHTQDPTSSLPSSSSSAPEPSSPASSTSAAPAPSWTPPAYGKAQPAVTAYLALDAAENAAFADPAHISSAKMDQYLIGAAKYEFDAVLYNEKKAGRAYRGTPAEQRVRVVSVNLTGEPKTVVLSSCPLASATDPDTEYVVATGKVVPATLTPGVPPPYGHRLKVIELSGQWLVSTFTVDAKKTCTP